MVICMPSNPSNDNNTVGFVDIVTALRVELREAVDAAIKDEQGVSFKLGEVEVELQAVVTKKVNGKAKFEVPIFKAELGGDYVSAKTQKIKFKLQVGKGKSEPEEGPLDLSNNQPRR